MADSRGSTSRHTANSQAAQPKPTEAPLPSQLGNVPPELVATASGQAPAALAGAPPEYWSSPNMYWQPPHPAYQRWMPYPSGHLVPAPPMLPGPVGYCGVPVNAGSPYQLGGCSPYGGAEYQQLWYQGQANPGGLPSAPLQGLDSQQLQQLQHQQQHQQQLAQQPQQHPQLQSQAQNQQRTSSRPARKLGQAGRAGRQSAGAKQAGSAVVPLSKGSVPELAAALAAQHISAAEEAPHLDGSDSGSDSDESCSQALARIKKRTVLASHSPEICNSWDWLPEGILREITVRLDLCSVKATRLVCARWRIVVDRSVEHLRLSKAKIHNVIAQFPAVKHIDMSGCQNVRNRNIIILARMEVKIKSLTLGHAGSAVHGKPRITNQAVASLASLTGLEDLRLADCGAITNNGMDVLSSLTRLTALAVVRCPRIADKGLTLLTRLPRLRHLDVTGCSKVMDNTLELAGRLPDLQCLKTGFSRISGAGIVHLQQLTSLTSLTMESEDVGDAALGVLGTMTQLRQLALPKCYNLTGAALAAAVRGLTRLTSLTLTALPLCGEHVASMVACLMSLSNLQVQGVDLSKACMEVLASLPALDSLGLDSLQLDGSFQPLARITQLTCLSVGNLQGRMVLVEVAVRLPQLQSLHLGESLRLHSASPLACSYSDRVLKMLHQGTRLRQLSLHGFPINPLHLFMLLGKLTGLQEVQLAACSLPDSSLDALSQRFPQIHFVRHGSWHLPGGLPTPPQPVTAGA